MAVVNKIIKYLKLYFVGLLLTAMFYFCFYIIFDLIFVAIDRPIGYPDVPDQYNITSLFLGFAASLFYFIADWWAFLLMLFIGNIIILLLRRNNKLPFLYNRVSTSIIFGICFLAIPMFLARPFDLKTFELGSYTGLYKPMKYYFIYTFIGMAVGFFLYNIFKKRTAKATDNQAE